MKIPASSGRLCGALMGIALVLGACGGSGGLDVELPDGDDGQDADPSASLSSFDESLRYQGSPDLAACSIADLNAWVEHDMRDYYIFYDQVPNLDTDEFVDPSDLVRALRVSPDIFSGIRVTADQVAQFEEGVTSGYGYWLSNTDADELRFRSVRLGSPVYEAGIRRGDQLLALNGTAVDEISNDEFAEIIANGENEPPTFRVLTQDGLTQDFRITPGEYPIFTSPSSSSNALGDGSVVGYLPITQFLNRTADDVDFHLARLIELGAQRLVLDLRYNGGGRSVQAQRVASQLLGSDFDGEIYRKSVFNDKYVADNFLRLFEAPELELPVISIAILTTERTASASEALINGLKPYADVVVIGDTTSGKPFGSFRVDYCDLSLNAMRTISTNSNDVSVAGGITPDCFVADEWLHETWEAEDALHRAALDYFNDGTCNTAVLAKTLRTEPRPGEGFSESDFFSVPASEESDGEWLFRD